MADAPPPAVDLGSEIETLVDMPFTAEPSRLKHVRSLVGAAARAAGFDEAMARDIVLAVDEACTNVIIHTYGGRTDGNVVLRIVHCRDGIRLSLRDYGAPVSVADVKPRDLDEIKPGGLGTHFINEIMDSVRFLPAPDGAGNILEMTKRGGEPR